MVTVGVVAVAAIAAIIAVIVIFTGSTDAAPAENSAGITLEDVLDQRYSPRSFTGNGTWVSANQILYRSESGDVLLYNTETLTSEVILSTDVPALLTAIESTLSPDGNFLLLAHDYRKLFRYSYVAKYTIVNLQTKQTYSIDANAEDILQLAIWAPVGNSIVFVARNNIYYRKNATQPEIKQITTDGLIGNVYNGVPDWIYEEEVFSSNKALWISPDGKQVAYAKFTDTLVKVMTLPVYGEPGSLDFQYTRAVQVRYPKPGTRNPYVSLHVADLETDAETINAEPPINIKDTAPILSAVTWAKPDVLCAIWMNRVQNEAAIVTYSTNKPAVSMEIIKYLKQNGGWLELFSAPIFSKDGSKLLLILSQDQGDDAGSYRHLTLLSRKANSEETALTKGKFVVTEILGWDENGQIIYYRANSDNDSSVQHVYGVSPSKPSEVKCLTCDATTSIAHSPCSYNSIEFALDFKNYVLNCEGPGVPESTLITKDKKVVIWENNEDMQKVVKKLQIPVIKKMTIDVADGFQANVLLKLPANLDTTGETKYPMLVNVYGGPDSYQVVDKFNLDWGSYLAANKSIIYATIDGRGSGLRGDKLLFSIYRRLGTVEIIDQINVTRQIQEKLPYIDETRTAIWGWSYGGFAAAMALAMDTQNIFKCGISVAPVTDWTLYDSIYTERFMGLPTEEDNLAGYKKARLLSRHEGLRDKLYFLIHGTLDDNVHYQQSMLWAKVLEQRDIMFRQMTYPDEDHGLGAVRPHLYHSLENFLDDCFVTNE